MAYRVILAIGLVLACCGCANHPPPPSTSRIVIVVPGAGGHGPGTGAVIRALREGSPAAHFEVFHWGAPAPLFMLNLQNNAIHHDAEQKLARAIEARALTRPGVQLQIIAHSAGCGVALGALAMLDNARAQSTILLSPSVSPEYDLRRAMANVRGDVHVFHSERDTLWLGWRASTFGTYDNVKTRAAGYAGFANAPAKVVQHSYQPDWRQLENNGGHFGTLSFRFASTILSPILAEGASSPPAGQRDDALRAGR